MAAPTPADLEMALLRFTAIHRQQWPDGAPDRWPVALVGEWRTLLIDLVNGLASESVAAERRLLLQVRITLEAELERAVRRFGPGPADVVQDTQKVFARVRAHLANPRTRPPENSAYTGFDVVWPVTPQIVTSPFGYRRDPILGPSTYRFHSGIDLGGRSGSTVVAAASGKVTDAGWSGGHGRKITVAHRFGIRTVYAHLKRVLVKKGQSVSQGQPIGLMGSTGRSTGPHLHFEVHRGNIPLDPLELLLSSRRAHRNAAPALRLARDRR